MGLREQLTSEWLSSSAPTYQSHSLEQCLKAGLGRSLPGDFDWGPLECGRGKVSHQCLGAMSSNTGSESPSAVSRTSTSSTETSSLENRQCYSGGVYQQERGRSPALTAQALELWAVALTAGVSVTAQHIPGIQNVVADTASRQIETRTEWTLDRKIFQSIYQRFYTPEVDLFASRLNHQVPKYVLRYPDPGALAVDAFLQEWSKWTCQIHPPVVLLPRVLRKIKEDRATAVLLIALNWTGQPWFPDPIQMLVDRPLLLPQRQSLLFLSFQPTAYHPLWKSVHLTVWPLSGTVTKQQAFQRKLLTSCWPHGERPPRSGTEGPGELGYAAVLNGVPVPFQLL